jgi:hypothetical protein
MLSHSRLFGWSCVCGLSGSGNEINQTHHPLAPHSSPVTPHLMFHPPTQEATVARPPQSSATEDGSSRGAPHLTSVTPLEFLTGSLRPSMAHAQPLDSTMWQVQNLCIVPLSSPVKRKGRLPCNPPPPTSRKTEEFRPRPYRHAPTAGWWMRCGVRRVPRLAVSSAWNAWSSFLIHSIRTLAIRRRCSQTRVAPVSLIAISAQPIAR